MAADEDYASVYSNAMMLQDAGAAMRDEPRHISAALSPTGQEPAARAYFSPPRATILRRRRPRSHYRFSRFRSCAKHDGEQLPAMAMRPFRMICVFGACRPMPPSPAAAARGISAAARRRASTSASKDD